MGRQGTLDGAATDNSLVHPGQISIHLRIERYGGDECLSPKHSQWSSAACLVASALISSCDAYGSYHEAFAGIMRRYLQSPLGGLEGQTLWRPWRVGHL